MRKIGRYIQRHWALAAIAALVAVPLAVLVLEAGNDDPADPGSVNPLVALTGVQGGSAALDPAPPQPEPVGGAGGGGAGAGAPGSPPDGPAGGRPQEGFTLASVRPGQRVKLREAPGGEPVAAVGDETEFGSPRSFWVSRKLPGWLGVPAPELPNGRLGWIRDDPAALKMSRTPYSITADLSARRVALRRGGRVVRSFPVTVGSPDSPTPPGRYAVTDGLVGPVVRQNYGCCVLALTGHQPNLPEGWIGGDRIAIHGTAGGVGGAASSGCLRARDEDMTALFRTIPLATPVIIRA